MRTDPDAQLMLQFKAGDQLAFRHLFDKHKRRVIHYCYRYCGHPAVAEELAQETFLRVYKAAPRYRPKARFSTWLFKIATNVCLNELRKPIYRNLIQSMDEAAQEGRNPVDRAQSESDPSAPDAMLASREQQAMVQKAIARLPEKERAALLLRVNEEFSYREIGRQINRSEGHVKTLIYRGRQRLKKILGAYFGDKHDKSM